MKLSQNFREFVQLLNDNGVRYLVVGGYAVNLHGYPRYTKDLDFWVWAGGDNIKNLLAAITGFGFSSLGLTESDFASPDDIIQLGYEPERIDLLVDIGGVDFEQCYANRETAVLDKLPVDFIGAADLIIAKRKAGRLQDRADAQQVAKILARKKANQNKKK